MHPHIPLSPLRTLVGTSVLIVLVALFAIVDMRTRRHDQQVTKQVPASRPGESPFANSVPQVSRAGDFVGESASSPPRLNLLNAYGKLPMSFEVNTGQADKEIRFLSRGSGYSLFLTSTEAVLEFSAKPREEITNRLPDQTLAQATNPKHSVLGIGRDMPRRSVLHLRLVGANPSPKSKGIDELAGKTNYFIGNDPTKWHTDISTYARVRYEKVYPGIDLVYYGNQGDLEYDLVVAPHADYRQIQLQYTGAKGIHIDEKSGDLIFATKDEGEVRQPKP